MALLATLLVLLFARDISRAGHGATSPRLSENRSFAALTNSLVNQENAFDARTAYLLTRASSVSRPVFDARLEQLAQLVSSWQVQASRLRRPQLAHDVNDTIAQLTEQRIDDDEFLLTAVANGLSLPWTPSFTLAKGLTIATAQASLVATSEQWNVARRSLRLEPGHVALLATKNAVATLPFATVMTRLEQSPSLILTRGVGITAVSVQPSPLPAPSGEILLPPTSSVHLGVTVTNASYATQRVSVAVVFTPSGPSALAQRQTLSVTLGPLGSYAFVFQNLHSAPSEHAVLSLSVAGTSSGANMSRSRRYTVVISPSGNG